MIVRRGSTGISFSDVRQNALNSQGGEKMFLMNDGRTKMESLHKPTPLPNQIKTFFPSARQGSKPHPHFPKRLSPPRSISPPPFQPPSHSPPSNHHPSPHPPRGRDRSGPHRHTLPAAAMAAIAVRAGVVNEAVLAQAEVAVPFLRHGG